MCLGTNKSSCYCHPSQERTRSRGQCGACHSDQLPLPVKNKVFSYAKYDGEKSPKKPRSPRPGQNGAEKPLQVATFSPSSSTSPILYNSVSSLGCNLRHAEHATSKCHELYQLSPNSGAERPYGGMRLRLCAAMDRVVHAGNRLLKSRM